MNLQFTEEQEMMRKMVRDFAQTEIAPFIENMEKGEFPREILKKMGELGSHGDSGSGKIRRCGDGFHFLYYCD